MDRAELIAELLGYERPVRDVLADLAAYGWDCDEPSDELTPSHNGTLIKGSLHCRLSTAQSGLWGPLGNKK
jgi:hypothetical protein